MALPLLFLVLFSSLASIPFSESALSLEYYKKSCPQLEDIVLETVHDQQEEKPETAAATLRVFFHDCVVDGCDASVLIRGSEKRKTEREHEINLSLGPQAYDLVNEIKTRVEQKCPGVVSCADILALSTQVLVSKVGGPSYKVKMGRKDGLVSEASHVEGNVARANFTVDKLIQMFQAKNLNTQEMVALVGGGHTIGFVHCKEIAHRIFHPNPESVNMRNFLAKLLREKTCNDWEQNPGKSAFLDAGENTAGVFDNHIFKNIRRQMALLESDAALFYDDRTKPFVEKYANDQQVFFEDFSKAMEKVSEIGVKLDGEGEIRRRCDVFNNGFSNAI